MTTRRNGRLTSALVGAGIVAAVAGAAAPALAAGSNVALGEVSTRVVRGDLDVGAVLRAAFVEQLRELDAPRSASRGPVILSAALVRMESEAGRFTCVVSATLRTARGGTMIAIVEGRAGVETSAPAGPRLVQQAVEAATHAAIARVPDALR